MITTPKGLATYPSGSQYIFFPFHFKGKFLVHLCSGSISEGINNANVLKYDMTEEISLFFIRILIFSASIISASILNVISSLDLKIFF